jgi:hypothetical protein
MKKKAGKKLGFFSDDMELGVNVLLSPCMKAFPYIFERHLAEVGSTARMASRCTSANAGRLSARELQVGKGHSGVLVLVRFVVVLLSWASCDMGHVEKWVGGI